MGYFVSQIVNLKSKHMKHSISILVLLAFSTILCLSQDDKSKRPSPPAVAEGTIDGVKINQLKQIPDDREMIDVLIAALQYADMFGPVREANTPERAQTLGLWLLAQSASIFAARQRLLEVPG